MGKKAGKKESSAGLKHKRSRILYQITILLVIVFIASGLLTFFLYRGSLNSLIEKSTDKLIQTKVDDFNTSIFYINNILEPIFGEKISSVTDEELVDALINKKTVEGQKWMNNEMKQMIDGGLLGMEEELIILHPGSALMEPLVVGSSDEKLVYEWKVPEYLLEAIEGGDPYLWMEDGIPELGLSGEYIIAVQNFTGFRNFSYAIVGIKPMYEEVAEINDFYNKERRDITVLLMLVIAGSIILVILITFLVLSFLIRKQITDPLDELSAVAEKVMEGNLDVEIEVRKGEELEGLKHAFKEMVESIRKMIARSVGED